MPRSLHRVLFGLIVLAAAPAAAHREPTLPPPTGEDLRIKLVTFGPGDAIHQYFGHNAIVVEDLRRRGRARLYNFGMFSFGGDMLAKYMKGRLDFWVGVSPVRPTFRAYEARNRSIRVQVLNLAPEKRKALAKRLVVNARPENRTYRYHHYNDNCSTRLRDLIDVALDGQFKREHATPARLSYRGHTRRYTQHDPVVEWLLMYWMNDSMEASIEGNHEAFLPGELELKVQQTTYVNEAGERVALVASRYTVFEARRHSVPHVPPTRWPWHIGLGLLLSGLALAFARPMADGRKLARVAFGALHACIGLVLGVPALAGFLMWVATDWKVTYDNENQLVANPLTLCALPLGIAIAWGSRRATRWMGSIWLVLAASSALALGLKALPMFDQDTLLPYALLIPMNLGFALVHVALQARAGRY